MYRPAIIACIVFFLCSNAFSQNGTSVTAGGTASAEVGFYNVENLYDTIPSPFYDDSAWTPSGRMKWNAERYTAKLCNLVRVLDGMSLDVVGLAEVENEQALKDLVSVLKTDYNYIHRTSGDYRGMDVVLLFKGDRFIPSDIRQIGSGSSRRFLYVRGELTGGRVDIIVCHLPSQMNVKEMRERTLRNLRSFADSLHNADRQSRIIIMGDFNCEPSDKMMRQFLNSRNVKNGNGRVAGTFFCPFAQPHLRGTGSYVYNDRWRLYDNILLSVRFFAGDGLGYSGCGIFIKPWLLTQGNSSRKGYPLRTFSGTQFLNGYSDHLPVFVRLEKQRLTK